MPKESSSIKPEKVIKNDGKRKITCKDLLDRFEPLTEEEQKDLLYVMLDFMDFYVEKREEAKKKKDKWRFQEHCLAYQTLIVFLLKENGTSISRCSLLKQAREERLEWEKKKEGQE